MSPIYDAPNVPGEIEIGKIDFSKPETGMWTKIIGFGKLAYNKVCSISSCVFTSQNICF